MAAVRNNELGRAIRAAREAKHLSRPELVALLGSGLNYVSVIEMGQRTPRPARLARIAALLDVDYLTLAQLAGYAPAAFGEYTVTTTSLEKAAWLRQLEARFEADDLEALYQFAVCWQPRAEPAAASEQPRRRRVSA